MTSQATTLPPQISHVQAYRLRWKRRRMLWRCFRARHQLSVMSDRTSDIEEHSILAFSVVRNEQSRLPFFLEHYRRLGVSQFLIVDNASDDGTSDLLLRQPDVSLWRAETSYRETRFGVDWSGWLQMRYGHGHWCLTVDADELLSYPREESVDLRGLTGWLDQQGRVGLGALMVDLFPKGPLSQQSYTPGQDPKEVLPWFDPSAYRQVWQQPMGNLWVQGGTRDRVFFSDRPDRAPTLNKLPLMKWNRRWSYVNSTHSLLPAYLNQLYDGPSGTLPSAALLHTKFLPEIVSKSEVEKERAQHFHAPAEFAEYYDMLKQAPSLWHEKALKFESAEQLVALGLINDGGWV